MAPTPCPQAGSVPSGGTVLRRACAAASLCGLPSRTELGWFQGRPSVPPPPHRSPSSFQRGMPPPGVQPAATHEATARSQGPTAFLASHELQLNLILPLCKMGTAKLSGGARKEAQTRPTEQALPGLTVSCCALPPFEEFPPRSILGVTWRSP